MPLLVLNQRSITRSALTANNIMQQAALRLSKLTETMSYKTRHTVLPLSRVLRSSGFRPRGRPNKKVRSDNYAKETL